MKTSTRLNLEILDDRRLPSATPLDLTSRAAEVDQAGFIVRQVDAQPTGTGYIKSFVRIQGAASGGGSEQGYNTTARPLQFDENKSPQFTRSLTLGEVPVVTVNGANYREFLLDINQKSSASKLSLDEVRIYLGDQPNLTGYNATTKQLAGRTAAFDLDANGDVAVSLDARLNNGSGSGDMVLLVPVANFAGADPGSYVYLYSKMGVQSGASANGGFEEWAVRKSGVSATGTGSLSGMAFFDVNNNGLFDAADGDYGLQNVMIQLIGVDDLGNTVSLSTTTGLDGTYSFGNLRPGTYSILETQPFGYADGIDTLGSLGGSLDNDRFFDIKLLAGQNGVNYNFAELFGGE